MSVCGVNMETPPKEPAEGGASLDPCRPSCPAVQTLEGCGSISRVPPLPRARDAWAWGSEPPARCQGTVPATRAW